MKSGWKYYDYCHESYMPILPIQGKLSSEALLNSSIERVRSKKDFVILLERIRKVIGPWNTVWGVKKEKGRLSWELYFYSHGNKSSLTRVASLLPLLSPCLKIKALDIADIERQPYFMFSIDVDSRMLSTQCLKGLHLYGEGRPGVFQGNSYYWDKDGPHGENYYDFYRMPNESRDFLERVRRSLIIGADSKAFLRSRLVRKLMACSTICVASKARAEGVYFSRVKVDQLLFFLRYFAYPSYIVNYVAVNRDNLDHMLYDVAFDCCWNRSEFVFCKSSYYSVV